MEFYEFVERLQWPASQTSDLEAPGKSLPKGYLLMVDSKDFTLTSPKTMCTLTTYTNNDVRLRELRP
jgi:hypothetical protein